jgi:hypothetical protein
MPTKFYSLDVNDYVSLVKLKVEIGHIYHKRHVTYINIWMYIRIIHKINEKVKRLACS